MHNAQLTVGVATVRALLADQFPVWRDLPVRELRTAGTVNAIFRIGDGLSARFPLTPGDPSVALVTLQAEAAAAAELAELSPAATPVPVALGAPGPGYPLPWSVQTWLPGRDATVEDPAGSEAFAVDLADFIACLRNAETRGRAFVGDGRGGHLPDHDAWVDRCLHESRELLDVAGLRDIWSVLRELPEVDVDVMSHGDLTPPNLLVLDGRLAGVLDTGGFAAADPALDLVAAWHLLDEGPRAVLRSRLGCGDVQWHRGMAWAFEQAMGLVWYYADSNPTMSRWGARTLRRLERAVTN